MTPALVAAATGAPLLRPEPWSGVALQQAVELDLATSEAIALPLGDDLRATDVPLVTYLSPRPYSHGLIRGRPLRIDSCTKATHGVHARLTKYANISYLSPVPAGTARPTARDGWRDLRTVVPGGVFSDKGQWSPSKEG